MKEAPVKEARVKEALVKEALVKKAGKSWVKAAALQSSRKADGGGRCWAVLSRLGAEGPALAHAWALVAERQALG